MKIASLLLALAVASVSFAAPLSVPNHSGLTIATPALKERKEEKLRLDNGLEIYLISDPGSAQSGAALAVEVGSFDDPKERPGMAHFVEHMLFLGTKKYPEEGGFSRFLDTHGGLRNAFTASDKTVFSFSVNHEGFDEALDRFGHFFIDPLFNPSGVARESKAINEEFNKNLVSPFWRTHHVLKELGNPDHPFSQFAIGNKETLHLIAREELIEWVKNHYSANLMHLVVLSHLSLKEMKEQVIPLFSKVPHFKAVPQKFETPLLGPATQETLVLIEPLRETQVLQLSFEIPPHLLKEKEKNPTPLLAYVLGHEGEESLLAQLKREELATALGAGTFSLGRDQALFTLSVELTNKGVKNTDLIVERVFQTVATLKERGIPKYLFDEMTLLGKTKYLYQSRSDVFEMLLQLAAQLPDEPLETFPKLSIGLTQYDPQKNEELLALMTPKRGRYTLLAHPKWLNTSCDRCEKWMGVPYTTIPLKKELVDRWTTARSHPNIGLPKPNKYLPNNFKLVHNHQERDPYFPCPTPFKEPEHGSFYYCADKRFFVPKLAFHLHVKTPLISETKPTSKVMADLYCQHLEESLTHEVYQAMLGGLEFSVSPTYNGISLNVSGFNQKALPYIGDIIQKLAHLPLTSAQFATCKAKLLRHYFNQAHENVLSQSAEVMKTLIYRDCCSLKEKYTALENLSYEEFVPFCHTLFAQRELQASLYGNISKKEAKKLWSTLKTAIPGKAYPENEHEKRCAATFPATLTPKAVVKKSPLEGNALILVADCGPFSHKNKAVHHILSKGLEEPFFSTIRTQKQMGYIVFNEAKEIENRLYLLFVAQSSGFSAKALREEIATFLQESKQQLTTSLIPKKRFLALKEALLLEIENCASNPKEMASTLHALAFEREGDFSFYSTWSEVVEALDYEEFVKIAQAFLNTPHLTVGIEGESSNNQDSIEKSYQKIKNQLIYSIPQNT